MSVIAIMDLDSSAGIVWIGEAPDTIEAFNRLSGETVDHGTRDLGKMFDYVEVWPDRPWNLLRTRDFTETGKVEGDTLPESWIMRTLQYGEEAEPPLAELSPELQIRLLRERVGMAQELLTEDDPGVLHASFRVAPTRESRRDRHEHL